MKKRRQLLITIALTALWLHSECGAANGGWDSVDRSARSQIFQINVAIKTQLKDKLFAQLADLSPRMHYPVFSTTSVDHGFRVVGYGTCFPVKTAKHDRLYFFTNKHVIDFGDGMLQECQRFFAAMRLHAERTAAFTDPETRYKDLMRIVNMSARKDLSSVERSIYQATVDSIWDTYDSQLSIKADPKRALFEKYSKLSGFKGSASYFIHPPGAAIKPPLEAVLYREAENAKEPDLAVLATKAVNIAALELESVSPVVHEPVQAAGYPIEKRGPKPATIYNPTFSTGKITRMIPGMVQFDAPVSRGDSGGPLLNLRGKVIGVIVRRASETGVDKFAGAISALAVREFVPELFSNSLPLRQNSHRP